MPPHTTHSDQGAPLTLVLLLPLAVAAIAYLVAARAERRRGTRSWPAHRTALWLLGLGILSLTLVGPLAESAHGDFGAHMVVHLLAAMVAPLFIVMSAPVTLALRSLDVVPARRLSRVLRSRLARFFVHPVTAAALNVGSLWVLFATPTGATVLAIPALHPLVTAHFFVTGYLFTAAFVGPDPAPHRPSFRVRLAVLLPAIALHGILAKFVAANPPVGVDRADALLGAQLMYYGGDLAELALLVVFFGEWFAATDPAKRRARASVSVAP